MKTDWLAIIISFQLGFYLNASMWRIAQDKTDDLLYPLGFTIAMVSALICRIIMNRAPQNP
jgi:hypothetical protein